ISGVDCGVGLKKIVELASEFSSSLGADDPQRDRVIQSKRIPDRDHPLSDPQRIAIAKLRSGQGLACRNYLEQSEVSCLVIPLHRSGELPAIAERHPNAIRKL